MWKRLWTAWVSFAPQILLTFVGLVIIAIVLPVLRPVPSDATGTVSALCGGSGEGQGKTFPGDLIAYHFSSYDQCHAVEIDALHGAELAKQLVGTKDACQLPAGHGSASCSFGATSCVTGSNGGCGISMGVPDCSVVQLDCVNNGSWGGSIAVNCGGCGAPPPQTHKACQNMACATVSGAGANTCTGDSDCFHFACQGQTCTKLDGGGQSTCQSDAGCVPPKHKECRNESCVLIDGAGADNCPNNCQPQTHLECQNVACVRVNGTGSNSCSQDGDCFHRSCQNNACVKVAGGGNSGCQSDNDCVPQTHLTCQNNACVAVSGAGSDSCQNNSDCGSQTHFECRNDACVQVAGVGSNTCSSRQDCAHFECRNQACVAVSGAGGNQCSVSSDCVAPVHYECRSNTCVVISGSGGSTCFSNYDCQPLVQRVVCDLLSVSPQSGNEPLTVTAVLSGHTQNGGSIKGFRFNFGDRSGDFTQAAQTMSHTFESAGSYTVSGYVIDNLDNQSSAQVVCQKVVTVYRPQVLGVAAPPVIPKTGPETMGLLGLLGSGLAGWVIRKVKRKIGT